jgi:hypothetical protein
MAVGALIAGPEGTLIGAIPLALGTVLAGYVPGIRDAAVRHQDEQVRLEHEAAAAQQSWDAVGEPALEGIDRSPAGLLRPDHAVVRFTGREAEIGVLRAWCASGKARSVRIIVGAAGVGKTRLALAVASEWESRGAVWCRVDAGQEAQAVAAARGVTSGPVLLLVDYAETRTGLQAMLRAVLADPGPIRVLLVARSPGEWWDRLIEASASAVARLLTEAGPIRLAEQITEETPDVELIAQAMPQFARALGCAVPDLAEFEIPGQSVPVLVLHTAALVAVLRFRQDPPAALRVVVAEGVLDELLEHEARYWRRTAVAAGLPDIGGLLKPVVAVAALLGAGSLAEAAEMVARVPDLSEVPQAERRGWARWLYEIYPADAQGRLGSLQPDLLAEVHVVQQLTRDTGLARGSLTGLPREQAEHALTVLARAWVHQDAARQIIADALRADLARLALPAAQVTIQTRSDLGVLLADALEDAPAPDDALIRVAEGLPYPSVALAQAHQTVTWRVLRSLPDDADPALVARWNDNAGLTLAQLGRAAEALTVTEKAVTIYRQLAETQPERYRPELAASLGTLGVRFSDLGRADEAASVTEEAVAIYQELAEGDPDRYRADLATAWSNLGVRLWKRGRTAEALPIADEAVTAFRELAAADPDMYRSYLARCLANLGIWHAELGHPAEALALVEEGAVIYRVLADANPDRYRPDFAQILVNLATILQQLGRSLDALPISEEIVDIFRELAEANPDRYRSYLAASLSNLGVQLSESERPAEALPVSEEAATIFRELSEANPDRYRPDLAAALSNFGARLSESERSAGALLVSEEAAAIFSELAQANPDLYRFGLALSLSNLGLRLSEAGRSVDALPHANAAVDLFSELAEANPDRHRSELAQSQRNLAAILSVLGQHAKAEQLRNEAGRSLRATP